MNNVSVTSNFNDNPVSESNLFGRVAVLVYGVTSYFIGVAGLVCMILAFAQLIPFGFMGIDLAVNPWIANIVLVAIWGSIHSIMARASFKRLLTRFIPDAAERPTYVLMAGVTSVLLFGLVQPIPGIVWSVEHTSAAALLWAVFAFGWVYLLGASFAINHFDLFGLQQVYLNFRNQPRPPIQFMKRAMYKFSRHPIQTGVLIGIWVTPCMSTTQLILSIGFTGYIFIGLWFEERDLIKEFGEIYLNYRKEAGMFLPKLIKR
ncbi:MAG: hypothetical protein KTR32_35495 [Granulosicoccus sp.]|nr:hypothetical protein [Granulosicoccus sp.]